ncbi:L,D-peptidoglycan transpeptidase YkuD (ErfK/YbiS/YcfS/YnhG family) [Pseudonocardia eucalypti]|uniref:L,D-transpeptidase family protein n=1 Tax=Pseudonocardia eucalypti TaxID=648755 RepID=UPI00182C1ECC|nr:L,D-peptidoglycan transpeptidase YkuD (ErfK/YbiS/YcfS/YnhG family) [Pseudonocardia eucalypti]
MRDQRVSRRWLFGLVAALVLLAPAPPAMAVSPARAELGAPSASAFRAQAAALPPGVPAEPSGSQVVTVRVASPASGSGELRAWQRESDGTWRGVLGPVRVKVGTDGVGEAKEGTNRTPRGMFSLSQAFGRQPNPGSKLPYRQVGNADWWVSDPRSSAYNTYRHCTAGTCPFNEKAGENLGQAGPSYDYAAVIGYNTGKPKPGAGSAFFLHVDAGIASAGCVVAPRTTVVTLLRWLDPAAKPQIAIGIDDAT